MVSVIASSAVDSGFKLWSSQNQILWNWYLLLLH